MDLPSPSQSAKIESTPLSLPENLNHRFQEAAQLDGCSEKEFAILAIEKGFLELQELGALYPL